MSSTAILPADCHDAMGIVAAIFVPRFALRIINGHHSFLPAFSGARPYHAAFEHGLKLIGATSYYVTDIDKLNAAPIIEQDVRRISHRDQVEQLIEKAAPLKKLCFHVRYGGTGNIGFTSMETKLLSLNSRLTPEAAFRGSSDVDNERLSGSFCSTRVCASPDHAIQKFM
jgi:hypothetical protein